MKYKRIINIVIIFFITLASLWLVPSFVKKLTYSSQTYPLAYYSSVLKKLCIIDFRDNKDYFFDVQGNQYPRSKYDSLLPLMNFRQLAMNGDLPDSINGKAIDIKTLRMKQIMFKLRPIDIYSPQPTMGVMMESMPKRGILTLPGDFFRIENDCIQFIDSEGNTINQQKSNLFTNEIIKKGAKFPISNYWGNPTTRKAYDEGYFFVDSNKKFFHIKMTNNRPFVKDTQIDSIVKVKWFCMTEVPDRRFYGFVFGENGEFGILEGTDDGRYNFKKIDVRKIDITKDEIIVLGNMLYWTIRVSNHDSMDAYAVDASSLKSISHYNRQRKVNLWDNVSKWLFPIIISPTSQNNGFVNLYVEKISSNAIITNIILAAITAFVLFRKKRISINKKIVLTLFIAITGLAGLFALLFVAKE